MSTISAGTTSTTTLIATGDTTGSLVFKTNDTGSGGTTAMTIGTSQNVGVGTSSPGQRLEVSNSSTNTTFSTAGNQLLVRNSGSTVNAFARLDFAGSTNNPNASIAATFENYGTGATSILFGNINTGTGSIVERMRIDSDGRVTVPYQPAFHAQNNNYITSSGIISSWTEIFDRGNNFNPSTGRFTAPVAGVYFFAMYALFYNLGSASNFKLLKNGSGAAGMNTLGASYAQISGSYFGQGGGVVIQLAANDYIEYYFEWAGANLHSGYIYAYGYLLG